jgi:hypothetical protein
LVRIDGASVRVKTPPPKAQGGGARARTSWGSAPGGGRPVIIRAINEAHATGLSVIRRAACTKCPGTEPLFHGIVKVP